jgi:hypothetical protein
MPFMNSRKDLGECELIFEQFLFLPKHFMSVIYTFEEGVE